MNIYVGNLSTDVSDDELREAFEAFGEVRSINIVRDRDSGESRGFGFVQMPSATEGRAAIEGMNDKDLKGRTVNVAEARPKAQSRRSSTGRRGGFGGGRGGFGGGGRGGGRGGSGGGRGKRRY
jgi:RNA recognition motif-containing protein